MDMTFALIAFWVSALLFVYGCAGYPLLMCALGRFRGRRYIQADIVPTMSVIVPAYNEAHVIEEKIANCLQLDYPADRLEILIASDGSTDGTDGIILKAAATGKIRGLIFTQRRGKAAVLNELARMASGEIVVFSDASTMIEPGSLRSLARGFADERVGCVSGIYRVVAATPGGREAAQEGLYWKYETFVRRSEARLGSMLGAHGALYAVRRSLFEPLGPGVINDDFVIPVTILFKGLDVIYAPEAVAVEDAREMSGFARRARIMMGNCQQLMLFARRRRWRVRPQVLVQLLSHKGLRVLMPFLLLAMYAASAVLPGILYEGVFAGMTGFFGAALLGLSPRLRHVGRVLIAAPYYVCLANVAAIVALYCVTTRRVLPWGSE